jgi:hypothetical protein
MSALRYTFRPLAMWPYPETRDRRSRSTFKVPWSKTIDLLARELGMLGVSSVVIGAALREQDIRLDGLPRSNARTPPHPGVELSFTSRHGRLVYATDTCVFWEHNVRSLALGLEALRAVDRFGITRHGEQYAGFRQLESGSRSRGDELIDEHGGVRAALHATHPDHGGDPRDFAAVQAVRHG